MSTHVSGQPIHISKNTHLAEPIQVILNSSAPLQVTLDEHAQATLVLNDSTHANSAQDLHNLIEVTLGEGADLDFLLIQRGETVKRSVTSRFALGRSSRLRALSFIQDGTLTKNEIHVDFKGEGAEASLKGLSVLEGVSEAYHKVTANHAAAHCQSVQFYKSIVGDRAKSGFESLVWVHPGAQKSDSRQLSRNLLLSDFATATAQPDLKILADDVSCAHGATVGQLDKDELFYLQSRGLSKDVARFVLTYGFAEEILEDIRDTGLKNTLEALVRAELASLLKVEI